MWKGCAGGNAARNAVFAAQLAAEGMTGPGHAFEGRDGLFDNATGTFTLDPFPNKGGAALVPRIQLKYWPVEANGQAVVWAALDLRDGSVQWTRSAGAGTGIAAYDRGHVYTIDREGFETAFDATSGAVLWTAPTWGGPLVAANGSVVFQSSCFGARERTRWSANSACV